MQVRNLQMRQLPGLAFLALLRMAVIRRLAADGMRQAMMAERFGAHHRRGKSIGQER